jgi:DNA topoisomerase VI subunit B
VYYLRDAAKQFLREAEQIEREAATAIQDLCRSLQRELDRLRAARRRSAVDRTATMNRPSRETMFPP